jgi:hypothetical protein
MYTINIGLNNPFTGKTNSVDFTLSKALEHISDITNIRVSYDGDEPTVIIRYAFHTGSLLALATALSGITTSARAHWSVTRLRSGVSLTLSIFSYHKEAVCQSHHTKPMTKQ